MQHSVPDGTTSFLESALTWLPKPMFAVTLLIVAIIAALGVHALLSRLVRGLFAQRHPFTATFVERTRDPARLAMVIFFVRLAAGAAPLDPRIAFVLGRVLTLAIILLLGWIAVRAVDIAAALYLRRFRLDAEDNLLARKHVTQVRVLKRALTTLMVIITVAAALMTFDSVRQYGVSLFASAGAAGLILGFAARPVLSNLIAGVQLAVTQPIRLEDTVIVEGEWGWVEDITSTYVVIRVWDLRRLIVPLSYFIEKPFQNWTRETTSLIGSVMVYVDYTAPVDRIRTKLEEIVEQSPLWDRRVVNLQVTDAKDRSIELRALVSAADASNTWDLRCLVREKLIAFLQKELPQALPRDRTDVSLGNSQADHGDMRPAPAI